MLLIDSLHLIAHRPPFADIAAADETFVVQAISTMHCNAVRCQIARLPGPSIGLTNRCLPLKMNRALPNQSKAIP